MSAIQINEQLLDEKLTKLEEARSWSSRVISKLETTIRTADDFALFRINPLRYAKEKGIAENEAIALFLYATKFGLFEMNWQLVCIGCGSVVESLRDLGDVHAHMVCNICSAESAVDLDDYIHITFTLSPQVRDLAFHHPESLPALLPIEEYFFKYHLSQGIKPPLPGVSFADALLSLTKARSYIAPGERKTLEFDVTPGTMQTVDPRDRTAAVFFVSGDPKGETQIIPFQLEAGRLKPEAEANKSLTPEQLQRLRSLGYVR